MIDVGCKHREKIVLIFKGYEIVESLAVECDHTLFLQVDNCWCGVGSAASSLCYQGSEQPSSGDVSRS